MRTLVLICLLVGVLFAGVSAESYSLGVQPLGNPTVRNNTHHVCGSNGRLHELTYSSLGHGDEYFENLNTLNGLTSIRCGAAADQIMLFFAAPGDMLTFIRRVQFGQSFLVGSGNWSCDGAEDSTLLRRILGAEVLNDVDVVLRTVPTKYGEMFSDLQVSVKAIGDCPKTGMASNVTHGFGDEWDKDFCYGVNAGPDCKSAASPIPLFNNKFIDVQCSNCFLGFNADVFFELDIHRWHLEKVAGGFRDVFLDGAMVLDANFQQNWGTNYEKTLGMPDPKTLISFSIGSVPFKITVSAPVQLNAEASFDSQAHITLGTEVDWNFGDAYLEWDRHQGWKHVSFHESLTSTPQLTTTAGFSASAQFSLVPTFILDIDGLFTYQITVDPKIMADASGSKDSGKACADLKYDLGVTSLAHLHVDFHLWFVHVHEDKTWGPTSLYESGVKTIGSKCINL